MHTAIYVLYSFTSLLLVYITAHVIFQYRMKGSLLIFLGAHLLVMISMFSIGIMIGGTARDNKTAGMLASILYFPMLIFSGATLPYEVMPTALQNVADFMSLTQGIKLLKSASLDQPIEQVFFPAAVILLIAAVCTGVSIKFFRWE